MAASMAHHFYLRHSRGSALGEVPSFRQQVAADLSADSNQELIGSEGPACSRVTADDVPDGFIGLLFQPLRPVGNLQNQGTLTRQKKISAQAAMRGSTRPQVIFRLLNHSGTNWVPLDVSNGIRTMLFVHRKRFESALPCMPDRAVFRIEVTRVLSVSYFKRFVQ